MIRHIVLWKLKADADKAEVKNNVKAGLEGLVGQIDGLVSATVQTQLVEGSAADMMLDTVFSDEAALRGYKSDPKHLHVANTFVRPFVEQRLSADYEIE
ncbi:MAG: Dabb family protein [Oscillospiraceae bacterium]|nr:Dabb family protein [Oscillospiraceae bacterium]